MPKITEVIPEGYEAVSRPIAKGMIDAVITHTGLRGKYHVYFNGDTESAAQAGSTLEEKRLNTGNVRFETTRAVTASLVEDFIEGEVLTVATWQKDHPEIFIDAPLNIVMKPVYHAVEATLSFSCRFPDLPSAEQWIKRLLRQISQGRKEMYDEIVYEYAIPPAYIVILKEIHALRENRGGYGDDFVDWLQKNLSPRATVLYTMAGKEPLLVIKESQKEVIGWFDWTIPPTPEKGDSGATYVATFNYRYHYNQVTGVHFSYPFLVHHQLLDEKYSGRNTPYEVHRGPAYMSMEKRFYEQLKQSRGFIETMPGIVYPYYDEWIPYNTPTNTLRLMTCVCTKDPDTPNLLLNLNDLTHWDINPDILAFMLTTHQWLPKHGFTPILLSVYIGRDRVNQEDITVDADGNVTLRSELDWRKDYRVMISALVDLTQLSGNRADELRNHPKACLTILNALEPRLAALGKLPEVVGGRLVKRMDYLKALEFIRTSSPIYKQAKTIGRFTVGTYFLAPSRQVD